MSQTMGTAEQKPNVEAESGARANSMTEATGRLLRTDVRPLITEEEPCALEGGNISTFRRKFIWQVQSSRFVDKPIPRVDSSDEYVEKRVNEIGSYTQHAGYSLTIKTEDGYGLIVFVKRGMYENVPRGMEKAREQSENAFANLFKIYPPKADPKDRRHTQALRNGLASGSDKVLPCGRTQFMYWYEEGHTREAPGISSASCPKDPAQLEAVKNFIKEISWENEPIGQLMELCDRESKQKFHAHTQDLRRDGLLQHLDQGPHAVNSSLVAIVNLAVQPHRDPGDARDGWTSTNSWGNYEGAWAVFPDLGIMIEQEPGDIMLCRSHYLEHWITKITSGERYSCIRMTKENVINPLEQWARCPVPGCDWISGRVASIRVHFQAKHFALSNTEVQSVMDSVRTDFPEYSAKDVKAISAALRSRMLGQKRKEKKRKEKETRKGKEKEKGR